MVVTKKLGGIVEESLSAIKLIVSFAQEEKEIDKFVKMADQTRQVAKKQTNLVAVFFSMIRGLMYTYYVFAFFVGSIFIYNGRLNERTGVPYNSGDVLSCVVAL
jgi:ABC-type multidrug transport system fused ATPase/permease subunit